MQNKLTAQLFGNSNAILLEEGNQGSDGDILGVIAVGGNVHGKEVDITRKVKQAIVDHFCVETEGVNTMKLEVKEVLTNQKTLLFSAEWEEDGEQLIRDFKIFIIATYK